MLVQIINSHVTLQTDAATAPAIMKLGSDDITMGNKFVGTYLDPNHPNCTRTMLAKSATEILVYGFDAGAVG